MKNVILRSMTCFARIDHTKFLKIRIKSSTDTLRSKIICHGLNLLKKVCCRAHRCIENLKKSI